MPQVHHHTMAQASLITLPTELLSAICAELCWHCSGTLVHTSWACQASQANLLSLSKTCRRLHATAEPTRYHCPFLQHKWSLAFLLRTLSERPDLAARLSGAHVDCLCRLPPPVSNNGHAKSTSVRLLEYLGDAARIPSTPLRGVGRRTQHAALILSLLRLAPNLQRLDLDLFGLEQFRRLDWPAEVFASFAPPTLRVLYLSGDGHELPLDVAGPVLRLAPNLQVLECDILYRVTGRFPHSVGRATSAQPPPLPNLTELSLVLTCLSGSGFWYLLAAAGPRLAKVSITRTAERPMTGDSDFRPVVVVEFDEALAALRGWRGSLRELSFTMLGEARPYRRGLRGARRLRKFEVLEVLQAQAVVFDFDGELGPQAEALTRALPPSIRRLRLFGPGDLAPGLRGLVGAVNSGRFGQLRAVEMDEQGGKGGGGESEAGGDLGDVAAAFRSAGVGFTVHPPLLLQE